MRVFISTTTFGEFDKTPLQKLRSQGIQFTLNPHQKKLSEEEVIHSLKSNSYIGLLAGTEPLTKNVFKQYPSLKVISRVGVGLDNIDLPAAKSFDIQVYNTPDILTNSVSELTLGLMLNCLRKISLMDRHMKNHIWKKEMGMLLKGKTLGLIGFGKIGQRVAELARAFGAQIMYYDTCNISSKKAKKVSLKQLFHKSDIISIHAATSKPLIAKSEIEQMKNGVILINTARGNSVHENALYTALRSGKIAFAALDVYGKEPFHGKLLELDNVVCTPHIGSYAKEARTEMENKAVNNLIQGLKRVHLI